MYSLDSVRSISCDMSLENDDIIFEETLCGVHYILHGVKGQNEHDPACSSDLPPSSFVPRLSTRKSQLPHTPPKLAKWRKAWGEPWRWGKPHLPCHKVAESPVIFSSIEAMVDLCRNKNNVLGNLGALICSCFLVSL